MQDELTQLLAVLKVVNGINDFGDQVGREMMGWEGPQVTAFNTAVMAVRRILEAHPEVPGYQPAPAV